MSMVVYVVNTKTTYESNLYPKYSNPTDPYNVVPSLINVNADDYYRIANSASGTEGGKIFTIGGNGKSYRNLTMLVNSSLNARYINIWTQKASTSNFEYVSYVSSKTTQYRINYSTSYSISYSLYKQSGSRWDYYEISASGTKSMPVYKNTLMYDNINL